MANVKAYWSWPKMYPLIGLRTRGILRGVAVFKHYWYGQRVDKLYYPYNPKSGKQTAMRTYYAEGVANWQGFADETKRYYNLEAKRFRLYGYHRYLKYYLDAHTFMLAYWGGLQKSVLDSQLIDTAIAAAITAAKLVMYPIGAIYISIANTNPGTFLGGTWAAISAGRVLVGLDSGDADFDTPEETGGAKTNTPSAHNVTQPAAHAAKNTDAADTGATARGSTASTLTLKAHFHNISQYTHSGAAVGNHAALSVVQPYFVVYMWKRTA
jgi:hypothetical protein